MTARTAYETIKAWASFAWVVVLALLLVSVTAQSRAAILAVQQTQPSLSVVKSVESQAILVAIGKVQRAPDAGQTGDAVTALPVPTAPPTGLAALQTIRPDLAGIVDAAAETHRPEPRAPPTA